MYSLSWLWGFLLILLTHFYKVSKTNCQNILKIEQDRINFVHSRTESVKGIYCPATNIQPISGNFNFFKCEFVANVFYSIDCTENVSLEIWQSRVLPFLIHIPDLLALSIDGLRVGVGLSQKKYITIAGLGENSSYDKKLLKKQIRFNKLIRPSSKRDIYSDINYIVTTQFHLSGVRTNVQNIIVYSIVGELNPLEINDPRLTKNNIDAIYGTSDIVVIILHFGNLDHEIFRHLARCDPNIAWCKNVIRMSPVDTFKSYELLTIALCNQTPLNQKCKYEDWGPCTGICGKGVKSKNLIRVIPPLNPPYSGKNCEAKGFQEQIESDCILKDCGDNAKCGVLTENGRCYVRNKVLKKKFFLIAMELIAKIAANGAHIVVALLLVGKGSKLEKGIVTMEKIEK